jgi:hypothetical protein
MSRDWHEARPDEVGLPAGAKVAGRTPSKL